MQEEKTTDIVSLRENRGIKQRSGEFRNAHKLDKIITGPCSVVVGVLYLFAVFLMEGGDILDELALRCGMELTRGFTGFGCILLFVDVIISIVLGVYSSGKKYHWQTTNEALILTHGSEQRYYYYSEIEDIRYERYGMFNRGWKVWITTELREDMYMLIIGTSRLYRSFEETPFYILMQNIGFAEPDGVRVKPDGELPDWVTFEKFEENLEECESNFRFPGE